MKEKKFLIAASVVVVFAELIIFFSAYFMSGEKRWIQVRSSLGDLVYEVKGDRLPSFDKYYFENNFGPLENFEIKLVEKNVSFPVRGWFFASIAFPVGLCFLFVFLLRILSSIFPSLKSKLKISEHKNFGFDSIKSGNAGLVFYTGLILFGISFVIWALPIIFNSATERFLFMISKYPIIFSVGFGCFFIFVLFSAYLRFKLKKYDIDKKFVLEMKYLESGQKKQFLTGNEEKNNYLDADKEKRFLKYNGDKD